MGSGTSGRIALFAATSLASFATPAAAYAGQERQFNVREQPAITGIPDFARQADVQIMVPQSATVGERTRAVNGRMAVDEGLARLIKGTSLAIRSNDGQTIALADQGLREKDAKPSNIKLCERGSWNERFTIETNLSWVTELFHAKKLYHRVKSHLEARLWYLAALINCLLRLTERKRSLADFVI